MTYSCPQCQKPVTDSEEMRGIHDLEHRLAQMQEDVTSFRSLLRSTSARQMAVALTSAALARDKSVDQVLAVHRELLQKLMDAGLF